MAIFAAEDLPLGLPIDRTALQPIHILETKADPGLCRRHGLHD